MRATRARIAAINARPMKGLGVSRRALFDQVDRPALRPLPCTRYELATWQPCRVNIDYHVQVDHNFYSVPYQLVHARVEARGTHGMVEVFFKGDSGCCADHADGPTAVAELWRRTMGSIVLHRAPVDTR